MEGATGKETDRWGTADELAPPVANLTRIRGQRDDHPEKTETMDIGTNAILTDPEQAATNHDHYTTPNTTPT